MSIAAAIYPDLKYHPTKTLIPLAMMGSFPLIMVTGPDNLSGNVKELIEWAKAASGQGEFPEHVAGLHHRHGTTEIEIRHAGGDDSIQEQ